MAMEKENGKFRGASIPAYSNYYIVLISGLEVPSVAPFTVVTLGSQRFETRVVEKTHPVWHQEHNMYEGTGREGKFLNLFYI